MISRSQLARETWGYRPIEVVIAGELVTGRVMGSGEFHRQSSIDAEVPRVR
jgi:hypothetical protein